MHPARSRQTRRDQPPGGPVRETDLASPAMAFPIRDRSRHSDSRCDRSPSRNYRNSSLRPTSDGHPGSSCGETAPARRSRAAPPATRTRLVWRIRAATPRPPPLPPETGEHQEGFQADRQSQSAYSFGVVEDHTDGMAMAGADPAYAVPEINAIVSACPLDRPEMHSESHRVALGERHYFGPRLHAGALLGQHEFTSGEIAAGL